MRQPAALASNQPDAGSAGSSGGGIIVRPIDPRGGRA